MGAPFDLQEAAARMSDPMWRLCNLYKIVPKNSKIPITFAPRHEQLNFIESLWYRNIILKARQRGFTTLICLLWLDHALFNANARCGVIAHERDSAEVIFRDKVKFPYDQLPEALRAQFPLETDSRSELLFKHNGSSLRVATSMRSGTINRLLISEYGKICARAPEKAVEVMTGSLQTVPDSGIVVIESTAEGQGGDFYDKCQMALEAKQKKRRLTPRDYRITFYAWWMAPEYCLPDDEAANVVITEADEKHFRELQSKINRPLSLGQRAWYCAVKASDMAGDALLMMREYPGTPEEAFSVSNEGRYYANELALARTHGRICRVPTLDLPVNTFWDVGRGDMTTIWFHQQLGPEHRFIRYHEASGEKLGYYVKYLQDTGYLWGWHYLPHDAAHKRLSDTNKSIEEMLGDLGVVNIEIVPQVTSLDAGIQATRSAFAHSYFDETGCAQGLIRLANYHKRWSPTLACWMDDDAQDDNVHGADAYRQFGQALTSGLLRGTSDNDGEYGVMNPRRPADWRI